MTILILGNGRWEGTGPAGLAAQADYIIAVDGGLVKALRHGIRPDLVIGDLDSLGRKGRAELDKHGIEVVTHPSEKDQTDLELALDRAIALKPKRLVLFGVLGARLDQSLVNIFLLEKAARAGIAAEIVAGRERVYLVRDRLELEAEPGDRVSLLPLTEVARGVRTSGLRYPLNDEDLHRYSSRGISNEVIASPARVELREGLLLVVHRSKPVARRSRP